MTKFWNHQQSWESNEQRWDAAAKLAAKICPLRSIDKMPKIPAVVPSASKNLKWKTIKYILKNDPDHVILKNFLKHPFCYGWNFLSSLIKQRTFTQEGDLFFFGVKNIEQFQQFLNDPAYLLVIGFSYCQKPFECPAERFSNKCIHDSKHRVCQQCLVGKCFNAIPDQRAILLVIPTIHYIGAEIFQIMEKYPNKKILFMITACELSLRMFSDLGNMVQLKGIGIRLSGRICNTFKAFELSEEGIKPGLTVVSEETTKNMLSFIRLAVYKNTHEKVAD